MDVGDLALVRGTHTILKVLARKRSVSVTLLATRRQMQNARIKSDQWIDGSLTIFPFVSH